GPFQYELQLALSPGATFSKRRSSGRSGVAERLRPGQRGRLLVAGLVRRETQAGAHRATARFALLSGPRCFLLAQRLVKTGDRLCFQVWASRRASHRSPTETVSRLAS